MSVVYDMQGVAWSGCGITQDVKSIELPEAWEKEVRDISTLSNTAVKTKSVATLKDYDVVKLVVEYDPAVTLTLTNNSCVVTLPDAAGAITFWGQISAVGAPRNAEVDGVPEQEITIAVTNLNDSGVETPPAFA